MSVNDYLISQYIDDELDLDEKIVFVEAVHGDLQFFNETEALLRQEKRLRGSLAPPPPLPALPPVATAPDRPGLLSFWWRPLAGFAAAMLLVGLVTLLRPEPAVAPRASVHRFVVYLPESSHARIVGTFTGWKPIPMEPVGTSGYWTLTLPLPTGEHRYSFLIEDGRQIADPTVAAREQDDFGGENSVIEAKMPI